MLVSLLNILLMGSRICDYGGDIGLSVDPEMEGRLTYCPHVVQSFKSLFSLLIVSCMCVYGGGVGLSVDTLKHGKKLTFCPRCPGIQISPIVTLMLFSCTCVNGGGIGHAEKLT